MEKELSPSTTDNSNVGVNTLNDVAPVPVIVQRIDDNDGNTTTSDLASMTSSRQQKTGKCLIIADWVQKGLFKYCKFITSSDNMEYGQPLSEFTLEENNIVIERQKWWNGHKRTIVQTLKEKRGCVVETV